MRFDHRMNIGLVAADVLVLKELFPRRLFVHVESVLVDFEV